MNPAGSQRKRVDVVARLKQLTVIFFVTIRPVIPTEPAVAGESLPDAGGEKSDLSRKQILRLRCAALSMTKIEFNLLRLTAMRFCGIIIYSISTAYYFFG